MKQKKLSTPKKLIFGILGVIAFLATWEVAAIALDNPAVPSMSKILKALVGILKSEKALINIGSTLKLVLIGVAMAFLIGATLGLLCEMSDVINGFLSPIIGGVRNVAAITLFPLLIVLFGIEDFPRIFVIFWTAFPAILLSTMQGLNGVDPVLIEAGAGMGANKFQIYRMIKIPLAVPQILNGLRIGMGNGFIAIVVAEMLGASKGLGFMVLWTTQAFKYSQTYAYILIIAIVGGLINSIMNMIIKKIERRIL